jgi:hypothetical protein
MHIDFPFRHLLSNIAHKSLIGMRSLPGLTSDFHNKIGHKPTHDTAPNRPVWSSPFRLSMSLAGSCFSSESAH